MNLFTSKKYYSDNGVCSFHEFARELDEDYLRTQVNGGDCGGGAPSGTGGSGGSGSGGGTGHGTGGSSSSGATTTPQAPAVNPGAGETQNPGNQSNPGYTGGGGNYEPPKEVMSNPQAYAYWLSLQDKAMKEGDPGKYKDYNVLGTQFNNSSNKTQEQNNQAQNNQKNIIMGKNIYSQDYIKTVVPLQYQKQALAALEKEEKAGKYGSPTDSKRITAGIGGKTSLQPSHTGVDIGALTPGKKGDPIYATADGTVKRNTRTANSGSTLLEVSLPYTNDTAVYQHAVFIVDQGETVKRGQVIGYMSDEGTPGQVHLHYEIRKDGLYAGTGGSGQLVDPLTRMPGLYYEKK